MAGKRFSVDAGFMVINKISKPARSMGRSITKFVRKSNQQITKLGRNFKKLGSVMAKSVKRGVSLAGVAMAGLPPPMPKAGGVGIRKTGLENLVRKRQMPPSPKPDKRPRSLRVPNKMKRCTEVERFVGWQGARSRQPPRVADAARRRQTAKEPAECRIILLGAL